MVTCVLLDMEADQLHKPSDTPTRSSRSTPRSHHPIINRTKAPAPTQTLTNINTNKEVPRLGLGQNRLLPVSGVLRSAPHQGNTPPRPGRDHAGANRAPQHPTAMVTDDRERLPDRPDPDRRHGCGTRIWVHTTGGWQPGMVVSSTQIAVTVRYRLPGRRGTGVDTFVWTQVAAAARTAPDPYVG